MRGDTGFLARIARRVRNEPLFHGVVGLSVTLAVGVSIATFVVVDAALLRPLAFDEPDRLTFVRATLAGPDGASQRYLVSPANLLEMRRDSEVFSSLAAATVESFDLVLDGEPRRLSGARVTDDLHSTLGMRAVLGRPLRAGDADRGVVVVGEGLWRRLWGGDPDILGAQLRLAGSSLRVVGVVPDHTAFPPGTEVWLPFRPTDVPPNETHAGMLRVVGRLADGVTLEVASSAMVRRAEALEALYPDNNGGRGIVVEELRGAFVEGGRDVLLSAMALALVFLLAATANVAGLYLVRSLSRARLLAVRSALGATRERLLIESVAHASALACCAMIAGLGLASLATGPLSTLLGGLPPGAVPVTLSLRSIAFAALASLVVPSVSAVTPLALAARLDRTSAIASTARGGSRGVAYRRLQAALVAGQTWLGVVLLLMAAGALGRLTELLRVDAGFGDSAAIVVRVPISRARHSTFDERVRLVGDLAGTLREIPGVDAAGSTDVLPFGDANVNWALSIETRPPADPTAFEVARGRLVTGGYFDAIGIPIVSGRPIRATDRIDTTPIVVVSEEFARRYWPGDDPLGKRIKRRTYDSEFPWLTVVGVAADVRDGGLDQELGGTIYMAFAQHDTRLGREVSFVVRSDRSTEPLLADVRSRVRAADPFAPLVSVRTVEQLVGDAIGPERTMGTASAGLAVGGLLLLAMGMYALLARVVAEHRRDIGLRRALGATAPGAVRDVVAGVLAPVALGLATGLAAGPLAISALAPGGAADAALPMWAYPVTVVLIVATTAVALAVPTVRAVATSPRVVLESG